MLLIRIQYRTLWKAEECIHVPVRNKYSFFHFPEPVEIRIGDRLYVTKPNAVIISRPDEPRWFHFFKDTHFNFFHARLEIGSLFEAYGIPMGEIFYPEQPEFLNACFRKLRMEFLSADHHTEQLQDAYIQELLIRLSRSINGDSKKTGLSAKQQEQLRQLRVRVLSQPEKKWTVEEMAQALSLSSSRFHVVYKAMFDISPVNDLIRARIDRAKLMLLEEDSANLSMVAERLGYKNPYDFCRQFTKVTGISPGKYRKENR